MVKDTFWFKHDYDPTGDPKMQAMLGVHGAVGYGIYWRIAEMLHSDSNHKLPLKKYVFMALAKQMQTSVEQISTFINECINDFELYSSDDGYFWSNRVFKNIQNRQDISDKRAAAGKASAEKRKQQISTNVEQVGTNVEQNLTSANNKRRGEEIREENKEGEVFVSPEMFKIFKKHFPKYPHDQTTDYTACLTIANRIGEMKGFTQQQVIEDKKTEIFKSWEMIVTDYIVPSDWFSQRSLADIASTKEWQRLVQSINGKLNKQVSTKKGIHV